jgi:hypothetical protein
MYQASHALLAAALMSLFIVVILDLTGPMTQIHSRTSRNSQSLSEISKRLVVLQVELGRVL